MPEPTSDTATTGLMRVPLDERTEAIRAHYDKFGFSGPTDLDRERDQVIGHLLGEVTNLRERLATPASNPTPDISVDRDSDERLSDENLDAHRISASIQAAIRRLRAERDQAIAHDRRPFPTAWAYEQACAALHTQRARAEKAEAYLTDIAAMATQFQASCTAEAAQLRLELAFLYGISSVERETQWAALAEDGELTRITEWEATDPAKWSPAYQLVSRPVVPVGDWQPTESPTRKTPGCDDITEPPRES
jgi:hypothetical protein